MKINAKVKEDLKKYLLEKIRTEHKKVVVHSSYKLSDSDKKLVYSKFPKIDFSDAKYDVDETLIAGIVITLGSQIIDLSIKGSLSNLKHIIYESA
ncbi:MAG: F0F1 ATP synthase subunit delta [bacterium]|nr:F0F1 ATP synthase subunit delta [bacterium]